MGKAPHILYTDDEGSYNNKIVNTYAKTYKKNDKFDKGNKPVWLDGVHRVENKTKKFGHKFYKVSGFTKLLIRAEVLKIHCSIR